MADAALRVAVVRTTPHTLTDRNDVRARVKRAHSEGFAFTDEELELGMRTLAVPVRDPRGHTRATMAVSAFTARISLAEMLASFVPVLRQHADRLGRAL